MSRGARCAAMTLSCTSRRRHSILLVLLIGEAPRVVPKSELHQRPGRNVRQRRHAGGADQGNPEGARRSGFRRAHHPYGPSGWLRILSRARATPSAAWSATGSWCRAGASPCATARTWSAATRARTCASTPRASPAPMPASSSGMTACGIEDCRSKNGTRIGEETVTGVTALRDGDRLRFGTVSALYRAAAAGMSTETHGGSGVLPHHADIGTRGPIAWVKHEGKRTCPYRPVTASVPTR